MSALTLRLPAIVDLCAKCIDVAAHRRAGEAGAFGILLDALTRHE